jgi:nucleotide-binding universal stress UspA family protein
MTEEIEMFKDVLVGVDTRSGGHDAVALARQLVSDDGRLTLGHVDDAGAPIFERNLVLGYDAAGHEATTKLLEAERRAAGPDVGLLRVTAASTGEGLHRLTETHAADLLVVGSCSRGRLGRAMLGDDTRDSLNGASCAVAVAPVGYAGHERDLSVIGVAYDGKPDSRAALAAARELAGRSGAAIQVCQVVSLPGYAYSPFGIGWTENIEFTINGAQERLAELDGVDGRVVYGVVGEELASFSRGVDLLIVGSRGYGPVRRLVHGSTSNYLLGHARCVLLVLPRTGGGPQAAVASDQAAAASDEARSAVDAEVGVPAIGGAR